MKSFWVRQSLQYPIISLLISLKLIMFLLCLCYIFNHDRLESLKIHKHTKTTKKQINQISYLSSGTNKQQEYKQIRSQILCV